MQVHGHPRIAVDQAVCGGRPTITGTRIRVSDILEMLAAGATEETILGDYPYLELGDLRAALSFAAGVADSASLPKAHRV